MKTIFLIPFILVSASTPCLPNLFVQESFDYSGTNLHGQSGGFGWTNAWNIFLGPDAALSDDDTSLTYPSGVDLNTQGDRLIHVIEGNRGFSPSIDLSINEDYYFSFIFVPNGINQIEVQFFGSGYADLIMSPFNSRAAFGGTTETFSVLSSNISYFVTGKFEAHAEGNDRLLVNFYSPSNSVPASEPAIWDVVVIGPPSTNEINTFQITAGMGFDGIEIDELRFSTTWQTLISTNLPPSPNFTMATLESNGNISLTSTNHLPGSTYFLETSTNPSAWTFSTIEPASNETISVEISPDSTHNLYRMIDKH